jgi:hypothetical protein
MSSTLRLSVLALFALGCSDVAIVQQPDREGDDPGECSDGADNDDDNLFDCDDPDCIGFPECDPNQPPTAPVVEVTPANPLTTNGIACTMTTPAEDPEDDALVYTFSWQVNGVDAGIEDAKKSAISPDMTTRDETWTCVAVAHDGTQYGPGGTASVVIGNTPPTAPEVSVHPGAPQLTNDLECFIEGDSYDADGDRIEYRMEWLLGGGPSGITGDEVLFLNTSVGDEWTCRVVPTDGTDEGPAGEWTVAVHMDLVPHVSAGSRHTCEVAIDTSLSCWGITSGASGDGGQVSDSPTQGSWNLVTAGDQHACAGNGDLNVHCWGDDSLNQLSSPLGSYHSLSAGTNHTCGVESDGDLTCWGTALTWPTVPPAGPFRSVSSGHETACMIGVDYTISCWNAPYSVPTGQFNDVAPGDAHACGIRLDGSIECFGSNSHGQVSTAPSGSGFTAITSGTHHSCAIDENLFVWCWGASDQGQASPPTGQFEQIDAGMFHTCGLRPDLSIVCWGCTGEDFGQCSP